MLIFAFALIPLTIACGPGTGPITATPTMRFTFSHPASWTYFTTPGPGQSFNEAGARNRINADIEFAVVKAVESFGYSTSGVEVRNAVAPESIQVAANCTGFTAGAQIGLMEDMAVTKRCTDTTNTTVLSTSSSISVTSPIALAQSNWENIATKVWQSLITNAGVKFYGPIEVS